MALVFESADNQDLCVKEATHANLSSFAYFSLLPKELQLKVWGSGSPQTRLIVVTESGNLSSHQTQGPLQGPASLKAGCKAPPLLYTCTASRYVAIQSYQSAFGLPILVNFDVDIFYFPSAATYHHFPLLVENHPDAEKVRNLVAVGYEEWPGIDWYFLAHRVFPNLNHVFMVKQSLLGDAKCEVKVEDKKKVSAAFEMLARGSASILSEQLHSRVVGDGSNRDSGRMAGAGFTVMYEEEFRAMLG